MNRHSNKPSNKGLPIALSIILLWCAHLAYSLFAIPAHLGNPFLYIHLFIQTYLYTGLFITAHDAMHGTVSANRTANNAIGHVSAFLFAGFSYSRLLRKHMEHHRHPGTAKDPDFNDGDQRFFPWLFSFFMQYVRWQQIVLMAILFNLLRLVAPTEGVIAFWIIPPFLATLQLFYFGTYRPHRRPEEDHMRPHHARTQARGHLWAMLSCYFFGYHWEHHQWPRTPWWQLAHRKDEYLRLHTNSAAPAASTEPADSSAAHDHDKGDRV